MPLEIQLDRIDQMVEVARKNGVRLAAIFQNRWNEANRAVKAAMDEGRFGRIAWAGRVVSLEGVVFGGRTSISSVDIAAS